jgi:serine/threonine protein kinase
MRKSKPKGRFCSTGRHLIDPNWDICPYCEAEKESKELADVKESPMAALRQPYATEHKTELLNRRYRIQSLLGQGTSATVYHAHDTLIDRQVVLKEFHVGPGAPSPARIQQEAKLFGSIDHPLIVGLHDAFIEGGRPYLVFSYKLGIVLSAVLASNRLSISRAYRYARDVLEGLSYLHSKNIIHRDIKPSNILIIRETNRAIISDLGISKLTEAPEKEQRITLVGELIGTPAYMAPELLDNKEASPASDVYSAGVTLFEMLTGQLPFSASSVYALIKKVQSEQVPHINSIRRSVPKFLDDLAYDMLSKKPADRPSSKEAFEKLLDTDSQPWAEIDEEDSRIPLSPPMAVVERETALFKTLISDNAEVAPKGNLAEAIYAQQMLSAEVFERRSKVWSQVLLGQETVATVSGGILLFILIFVQIAAFFLEKDVPEILNNSLLVILGYFFSSRMAARSVNKQSE